MDFYITDRTFALQTVASTLGETPFKVVNVEDVSTLETSSRRMTMDISFTPKTTKQAKEFFAVGNYVLYTDLNGKQQWQTIMKAEHDPLNQIRSLEMESAGLDLLNETVSDYKASKAENIAFYINHFANDSGFIIGVNEIKNLTRKLEWEGTVTALERLLSVATQFDNAELEFRFEFVGNELHQRYIDIKKKRGTDNHHRMYVNVDINSITTSEDIYSLVNAIYPTGGTPEGKDNPINLKGYDYTDPDGRFYLEKSTGIVKDTQNIKQWSRTNTANHYFLQHKEYESTSQKSILDDTIRYLKDYSKPIITYNVDIANVPDGLVVGDTIELVDENEELYLSSRVQQLTFDYTTGMVEAELSDFVRLASGIDEQLRQIQISLNNKTEQVFNSVPQVYVQPEAPENPKERDIWWVQTIIQPTSFMLLDDARANEGDAMVTGYKVYKDGMWVDQTIDQSILNIETLNAVNINGSIINGSKFINTWNITQPISGGQSRLVGNTTIENGAFNQGNNTYITATGSTIEKLRSEENTLIERGTVRTLKNTYDVATGSIKEHAFTNTLSDGKLTSTDVDLVNRVDNTSTIGGGALTLQTINNGVLTSNSRFDSTGITVNGKKQFSVFYGNGPNMDKQKNGTLLRIGPYMGTDFNTSNAEHDSTIWFNSNRDVIQFKEAGTYKFDINLRHQGNASTDQSRYVYSLIILSNKVDDLKTKSESGYIHAVGSYAGTGSLNFRFIAMGSYVLDVPKDYFVAFRLGLESDKYSFITSVPSLQITKVFK